MRFAFPLVITLAAFSSQVTARAFNQHVSRGSSDVCAEVDAHLVVPGLFPGQTIDLGLLSICLCLSGIPGLMSSSPLVITAVALAGPTAVKASLTDMVNSASGHQKCSFPDNADPVCAQSNPCGFNCNNGFTPSPANKPTDCVCSSPKTVCNGVCGTFKACPSSHPKRDLEMQKRSATCDRGLTACGVYGWTGLRSTQAWECLDTQSDLESCGGCAIPLTLGSSHGIDCTSIPGVADVSCNAGNCVVHRCLPGYAPVDRSYCVHKSGMQVNDISAAIGSLDNA